MTQQLSLAAPHAIALRVIGSIAGHEELLLAQLRRLGHAATLLTPDSLTHRVSTTASHCIYLVLCGAEPEGRMLVYQARERFRDAGIVAVSLVRNSDALAELLVAGADQYLALPCNDQMLQAIVSSLMRRLLSDWSPNSDLVHLSCRNSTLRIGDQVIKLRRMDFQLCEYLILNRGRWVPERELLRNVMDVRHDRETSAVRVHVRHIRQSLGELAGCLRSKRGMGYRFCLPD